MVHPNDELTLIEALASIVFLNFCSFLYYILMCILTNLWSYIFHSTYSWYGRKGKISAPQYIDLVMTHIQKHVEDESCLPSKYGKDFHHVKIVMLHHYIINIAL